jgi:hypothetical protein
MKVILLSLQELMQLQKEEDEMRQRLVKAVFEGKIVPQNFSSEVH